MAVTQRLHRFSDLADTEKRVRNCHYNIMQQLKRTVAVTFIFFTVPLVL